MLELYTWGPAFGLPSIDPECLATVVYLYRALPPEQWLLVMAHDASFSPAGILHNRPHVACAERLRR